MGLGAILIWGLSAAFTRTLGEHLGLFTSAALVNILGGVLAYITNRIRYGPFSFFRDTSKEYLLFCGPLYAVYVITSYMSTIISQTREQVLVVVLIKFAWPVLTLLFTIPILKKKVSPWIWPSCGLGLAGIIITTVGDVGNWKRFQQDLFSPAIILPIILGIISAVAWALYSVLTKKFLETAKPNAERIGHFMILTGFMMGIISFFFSEPRYVDLIIFGELFFQVVFTTFLATLFWNMAMCHGNIIIVVSISNFLPVIATVCGSLVLGVPLTLSILAGSALVTASTIWSNICFNRS